MENFERKRLKELREINLNPHEKSILKELKKGFMFYGLETREEKFTHKNIIPLMMARNYYSKLVNVVFAIPKSHLEWNFEVKTIYALNIINIEAKEGDFTEAYIDKLTLALSSAIKEEVDEVRKLNVQPFNYHHQILHSLMT